MPAGRFLDNSQLSNSIAPQLGEDPDAGADYHIPSNTWIEDLQAEWTGVPGGDDKQTWRTRDDSIRWNSIRPNVDNYFDEDDQSNELDSSFLPNECPRNVWKQDLMFNDRMAMNWSVPVEEGTWNLYNDLGDNVGSSSASGNSDDSLDGNVQRNRTVYFR